MSWRRYRLKHVARINARTLAEDTPEGYEFRYIDISAVGRGRLVAEPQLMEFGGAPSRARRLVSVGDTIISTVRTYLRAVYPITELAEDVVVSTGFAVMSPGPSLDSRFLAWWAQSDSCVEEVVARSVGVSYPAVNASDIGDLEVRLPALLEQREIADFLDAETIRIDALIEKKQRMIEMLEQRQQAFIDSLLMGHPIEPLKHAVAITVSNVDKLTVEGQVRVRLCNYTDVYYNREITGELSFMEASATPEQVLRFELRRGDVVITKDSETPDDIAVPAYVPNDLPGVVCGYHLAVLRPRLGRADGVFVYWALRSMQVRDQLSVAATGVTRFGLRTDAIGTVMVPLPPQDAQRAIAGRLRSRQLDVDRLASALMNQIELLREHRQALITASVTGQVAIAGAAA